MSPEQAVPSVLELRSLQKYYGKHQVICDLDLSVRAGESVAIIGHNGAGKTTLMKLLLGLTRPSGGNIILWGEQPGAGQADAAAGMIGFLPETVSFHPGMSGRQMLRFYAGLKREPLCQCDELLDLLGLGMAADRPLRTYSKGMRQRLGLAQALLGEPRLLLLDEPTTGLDPFLRQHFYEILGQRQAAGATIMVSSHALTEIEAQTDRIVIMQQGRIIANGSLDDLRQLAGLPVSILVRCVKGKQQMMQQAMAGAACQRLDEQQLVFHCNNESKLALLHRITAEADCVEDVSLNPPRLSDLYAHFVNGDEP